MNTSETRLTRLPWLQRGDRVKTDNGQTGTVTSMFPGITTLIEMDRTDKWKVYKQIPTYRLTKID